MILIATIGGILALLFWGLSDYFTGKSGQEKDEYLTNFVLQGIGAVLMLPIFLLYGLPIEINSALLIVVIVAILITVAYISFIKALRIGPFGVAAPLANSYAFITLIIGLLFFQFQIEILQIFALGMILFGVIMLVVDRTTLNFKALHGSTIQFAAITMLTWGIGLALLELVIDQFAWHQLVFLVVSLMTLFALVVYTIMRKRLPTWTDIKYQNMRYAWQSGLLGIIGTVAFFIAAEQSGSIIVPAVIASASPLATSFMAYYRDKEKLSLYKRLGAIIIIIGLMVLNI